MIIIGLLNQISAIIILFFIHTALWIFFTTAFFFMDKAYSIL